MRSSVLNDMLVYLDSPYYAKGSQLYLNHYQHKDHVRLATFIKRQTKFRWLTTYDHVPEIEELYQDCQCIPFHLSYSVHGRKVGKELLIHKSSLVVTPAYTVCPTAQVSSYQP